METKETVCCCLTNDREKLKAGILECVEKMDVAGLKELYFKAETLCGGERMEATVKEKMIQYMVERMREAEAGKVRTLFLCATNIL